MLADGFSTRPHVEQPSQATILDNQLGDYKRDIDTQGRNHGLFFHDRRQHLDCSPIRQPCQLHGLITDAQSHSNLPLYRVLLFPNQL